MKFSSVPEGSYFVCAFAEYGKEKVPAKSNGAKIVVDRTPPVIQALAKEHKNAPFSLNPTLTDSSPVKMTWSEKSSSGSVHFSNSEPPIITITQDGDYELLLTATDSAGNTTTQIYEVSYDTQAPLVNAGPDVVKNAAFVAAATVSGATSMQWSQVSGPADIVFADVTLPTTSISATADGEYILRLTATDAAGNTAFDDFKLNWNTSGPLLISLAKSGVAADGFINDAEKLDSSAVFALTASFYHQVEYSAVMAAPLTCNASTTYGEANLPNAAGFPSDGEYGVCVHLSDLAGNHVYAASETITRDTQFPDSVSYTLANDASDTYVNAAEINSVANLIALTGTGFTAEYSAPLSISALTCDNSKSYTAAVPPVGTLPNLNGAYAVCAKLTDAAGNITYKTSPQVNVDLTPPTAFAGADKTSFGVANNSDATSTGAISWQWTQESGPGAITFGSPTAITTTAATSTEGTYVLRLTATDAAGNSAYSEMTFIFDNTAPVFTSLVKSGDAEDGFVNDSEKNESSALWALTSSGHTSVMFTAPLDNTGTVTCNGTQTYDQSSIATASDLDLDLPYVICVELADAAGNITHGTSEVVTRDTVFPTVELGGDRISNGTISVAPAVNGASSYQWSKVSGTGTLSFTAPTAADTDVTTDTDGAFVARLTVTDVAGNSASDDINLTWDAVAPIVTSFVKTGDANDGYINNAEKAGNTALWAIAASGYSSISYSAPLSNGVTCNNSQTYGVAAIATAADLPNVDGSYVICVELSDNAGNYTYEKSEPVNRDIAAPTVDVGSDIATNTIATINAAVSGATSLQWTKESGSGTINFSAPTSSSTNVTTADETTYVLRLTATDDAGNSAHDELTFLFSTQVPTLTSFAGANEASNGFVNDAEKGSTSPLLSIVAGNYASISYTVVLADSALTCDASETYSEATIPLINSIPAPDGSYAVCVKLVASGGGTTYGKSQSIVKDTNAPTVDAGSNVTAGASAANLVGVTSGASSWLWSKQAGSGTVNFSTGTAESTSATPSAEDTYTLRLTATDAAGNSAHDDMTLIWDTTGPSFTSLARANEGGDGFVNIAEASATNPLWTLSASGQTATMYTAPLDDTGAAVNCSVGQTFGSATIARAVDLGAEKPYVICVRLTDAAGNVTYGKSEQVTRDTIAPSLSSLNGANGASDGYINASEAGSGAAMFALSASGQTNTAYTIVLADSALTCDDVGETYDQPSIPVISSTPGADGAYAVCVRLTDVASNITYGKSQSITKDTNAPTVNVGSNIVSNAAANITPTVGGATTYTWTKQSGSGTITFGSPNAANTTATASAQDDYVLRLTAADVAGNTAFDELLYTYDTTPPTFTSLNRVNEGSDSYVNIAEAGETNPLWTLSASDHTATMYTAPLDDTGAAVDCSVGQTFGSASIARATDLSADKPYVICVRLTDAAGNITYGKSQQVTRDTVAPTVNAGSDITSNVAANITTTVGGATTYAWTKQSGSGTITFGSPSAANTTATASAQDTYVLRLSATDAAGNSAQDELNYTFDTTAPSFTSLIRANEGGDGYVSAAEASATNPLWTLSASGQTSTMYTAPLDDTGSTVNCSVGQTFGSATIARATDLGAEKPYVICVRLTDAAGNTTYGKSQTVTRDVTAPPALSAFSGAPDSNGNGISLSWTYPGSTSDYSSMVIRQATGGSAPSCSTGTAIATYNTGTGFAATTYGDTSASVGNTYSYRVCITDTAGNETSTNNSTSIKASGSHAWDFSSALSYTFDALKVAISGGLARLVAMDQDDNSAAEINAGQSIGAEWSTDGLSLHAANAPKGAAIPNNFFDGIDATNLEYLFHFDHANYRTGATLINSTGKAHGTLATGAGDTYSKTYRGVYGYGLYLDGNDTITVPDDASNQFSGDFTLAAWVYVLNGTNSRIISKQPFGAVSLYHMRVLNNKLQMEISNASSTVYTVTGTTSLNDNRWHFVVGQRIGSTIKVFVDGNLEASAAATKAPVGPSGTNLSIGHDSGLNIFNGFMDEVAIFSRALSESEISTIFQNQIKRTRLSEWNRNSQIAEGNIFLAHLDETSGSIIDSSAYENTGTVYGATYNHDGSVGKAMYFDGVNDRIDFGESNALKMTSSFSTSLWLKLESYHASGVRIIFNREGEYEMGLATDGTLHFALANTTPGFAWVSTGTVIPLSTWTHVALTYSSTGGPVAYVNGKRVYANPAYTGPLGDTGTSHNKLILGYRQLAVDIPFHGHLDEFALWNRAQEVQTLFDYQTTGYAGNTRERPTMGAEKAFVDMSTNVLLMTMNEKSATEGRTILDHSGKNNTGTLLTGSDGLDKSINGQLRSGLTLDGNDAIKINHHASLCPTYFSLSSWFKFNSGSPSGHIIAKSIGGAVNSYALYLDNGEAKFLIHNGTTSANTGSYTLTPNTWYHAVATYTGFSINLYINGRLASTLNTGIAPACDSSPVFIGADDDNDDGNPELFLTGAVDESAIWSKALTASDIEIIYRDQAPKYLATFESRLMDATATVAWENLTLTPDRPYGKELANNGEAELGYSSYTAQGMHLSYGNIFLMHFNEWNGTRAESSGSGYTGTPIGSPLGSNDAVFGRSITFDGVDDYIDLPDGFADLTTMTASAWIKPMGNGAYERIFDFGNGDSIANVLLGRLNQSNQVLFAVCNTSCSTVVTPAILEQGVWQHIAVRRAGGGTVTIFKNGTLVHTGTAPSPVIVTRTNNYIGKSNWADALYKGGMDEVAIWNRYLSNDEIKEVYLRGAVKAEYQVRTCRTTGCQLEEWKGYDGMSATYFSEFNVNEPNPAPLTFNDFYIGLDQNRFFQYRMKLSSNTPDYRPKIHSVAVGPTHYSQSGEVVVNTGRSYTALYEFSADLGDGTGSVTYQISRNGTNWYYHNGTTWVAASTRAQSNTAAAINSNIGTFSSVVGTGTFYFKAFFNSTQGGQQIELNDVSIKYVP